MFPLNADLTAQVFLLNVNGSHFGGEVFGLYGYRGKEIGEWAFFRRSDTAFHHGCVNTEQSTVAFCTDNGEAFGIHPTFIKHSGEGMLGFGKFGTSLNTLIIKKSLMNDFGPASLDCEVILSKGYF